MLISSYYLPICSQLSLYLVGFKKNNMKNYLMVILLMTLSYSYGQTTFKEGYYITNSNSKIKGFIKDSDWKNSPKKIEFKENKEAPTQLIETNQIVEFQIENAVKFIRADVKIEKSSTKTGQLQIGDFVAFENENLLLKVLVEGKASLYQYYDNGIEKYFYATDTSTIEQLLYITYLADENDYNNAKQNGTEIIPNMTLLTNNTFKKQLLKNVNCNSERSLVSKLKYKSYDLKKYFEKYNECSNANYNKYYGGNKSEIKIKSLVSSNFNSVKIYDNGNPIYSKNFSNSINLGFGFEVEAILPFNNNKWSVFVAPTYNQYHNKAILYSATGSLITEQQVAIYYTYIQVPIGFRYYMYINPNSSIFINPIYNIKLKTGKNGVFYDEISSNNKEIFNHTKNYGIGFGYNYKRFSIESSLLSNTQIMKYAYNLKYINFSSFSVNLKYHFN